MLLVILILIIKTVGTETNGLPCPISLFLNELALRVALPAGVILFARVLMHKVAVEVLVSLLVVELFLEEAAVVLRCFHTFHDLCREAEHRPHVGSFPLDFQ